MHSYMEIKMTDLLGAADVSGNPIEGNYKYMGLVIGTKENLNSISKRLELNQFSSKRRIKDKGVRKSLASKLEFNCRESIVFCVKIDKNRIINKIIVCGQVVPRMMCNTIKRP